MTIGDEKVVAWLDEGGFTWDTKESAAEWCENTEPVGLIPQSAYAELAAELADARDDLAFVERWVNHHAQKPHNSAKEVLTVIQFYPPIQDITKAYADGKLPQKTDPWTELSDKLQAAESQLAELRARELQQAQSDALLEDTLEWIHNSPDLTKENFSKATAELQQAQVVGASERPIVPRDSCPHCKGAGYIGGEINPSSCHNRHSDASDDSGIADLCQRLSEHGAKSGRRAATKMYNDGVPTHTEMLMGQAVDAIRRLATPQSSAPVVGDEMASRLYSVLKALDERGHTVATWDNAKRVMADYEAARELQQAQVVGRCPHCDDTGDVHTPDGEWHGVCSCPAGDKIGKTTPQSSAPVVGDEVVSIPRATLKWWRELVDLNPADLAPRIESALTGRG